MDATMNTSENFKKLVLMECSSPQITPEEFHNLLLPGEGFHKKLKVPLPHNDAELEALSKWIFGTPLHLSQLDVDRTHGFYEVRERHDSYYDREFNNMCIPGFGDYEIDSIFWRSVMGILSCGGIASFFYGQFKIDGYRQYKRLSYWKKTRGSGLTGCSVRPAFVGLALRKREGREQTELV